MQTLEIGHVVAGNEREVLSKGHQPYEGWEVASCESNLSRVILEVEELEHGTCYQKHLHYKALGYHMVGPVHRSVRSLESQEDEYLGCSVIGP